MNFVPKAGLVLAAALLAFSAQAQELTGTLKKIKDTGTITVGHRDASIPFSYYNDQQQPVGYAMDLCARIVDAVKNGDVKAVRAALQQGVSVSGAEPDGTTALHEAVRRENVEMVDVLLAAHADAKAANRYNITPLSLACANGNAALIERLLKAGADPNATSEEGQTALMTAALNGKVDAG